MKVLGPKCDAAKRCDHAEVGWYAYSIERVYGAPLLWDLECSDATLSFKTVNNFNERQGAPALICVSMAVRQQLSVALLLALAGVANALAPQPSHAKIAPAQSQLRRRVCLAPLLAPVAGLASQPAHAASNTKKDAEAVLVKLEPLAGYIDDAKWDSVRTVLKTYVARRPSAASFRAAPERTSRGLLARRARDGDRDRAGRPSRSCGTSARARTGSARRRSRPATPS